MTDVLDKDAPLGKPGLEVPKEVQDRLTRSKAQMKRDEILRNESLEFWRGRQYVRQNKSGYLVKQGTVIGEKPDHIVRMTLNELVDPVEHEVASCTRRSPVYEVDPSTTDPEDTSAAGLGQKVALYGYDKWKILNVRQRCVSLCTVADEAFAWPYFDNTVGRPLPADENGDVVCEGEIRVRVFTGNEVGWEPGVSFDESRYHVIRQARPVDEVEALPGFLGGKLTADASTARVQGDSNEGHNLVLVTEYLERPSIKNANGKRVIMANDRVICREEPYPCVDPNGDPVDEPVLHYLPRFIDPDRDRGLGIVRFALDAVRVYNGCTNRIVEWINLALNPQLIAKKGTLRTRPTNEPGAIIYYVGQDAPKWREVPSIPPELFRMREEALMFLKRLFSQNEIPSQVEAGRAIQALLERDENTRAGFIQRLAEWDSRLMRHCLYLVARHYSEPRLLKIRGRFGSEAIQDFKGADLRGQCDVRVFPTSIEPLTRASVEQKVMNWVNAGLITDKDEALRAVKNGTADLLVEDYELSVAKANRQIRKLKALTNVMQGVDDPGADIPIADEFDKPQVHIAVLTKWLLTEEFEMAPEPVQEAAKLLIQQYQQLDMNEQMRQQQMLSMSAESQGMDNAGKTQGPKPMGSLPALPA